MIALIDCNNFYCSCEQLFKPAIGKKPIIVLSNNDGCAISRNEKAKGLGIQMAQPAFMISDLIEKEQVQVFSSNYTLYGDISERVMHIIKEFVPKTEVYSIDEVFADLSDLAYTDLFALAVQIRSTVMQCTGIPVSIGIGPTKTLAKMANRFAKKHQPDKGVFVANNKRLHHYLLSCTDVGDIWGIGNQHKNFLYQHGFTTALQLTEAPEEWVRKNMSVVGQRLLNELKGVCCIEWEETKPKRKNVTTSRSFGTLITGKKEMREAVAKFTSSCGEKLRKENSCARKLNVFIQTNPHRPEDRQYFESITLQIPVPTNVTTELIKYSMKGLDLIYKPGFLYQKAGVIVTDLVPVGQEQLSLFEQTERNKMNALMQSLDDVNQMFGRDKVRLGVHDYGTTWKLKQEALSPSYTTNLFHVPKAKA